MSLFQRGHSPASGHLAPGDPPGGQATACRSRSRPPLVRGSFRTCHSHAAGLCGRVSHSVGGGDPPQNFLGHRARTVHCDFFPCGFCPCAVTPAPWKTQDRQLRVRPPSLVLLSCPPLPGPPWASVCSLCCLCSCGGVTTHLRGPEQVPSEIPAQELAG